MTASTELLREQMVQEMQSLRMQLAKSQMALASLVGTVRTDGPRLTRKYS